MSGDPQHSSESHSLRKIGKVTGIHGLKGELFVHVFSKDTSWLAKLKEITLEDAKGIKKSYQIISTRPYKQGFLVFIEGVADRTEAEKLRACLVHVDGTLFVSEEGDEGFYLVEIEGFKVYDQGVYLGTIEGFSSNGAQDLLIVGMSFGPIDIPLVADFLMDIDFDKKEVHMKLPEGLIEVQREAKK